MQILGLVAGLMGRQGSPVPLAFRPESADVYVVGGDVTVALERWLPRDDDGVGRAGDGFHAGWHFRQVFLGDAIEGRRGNAVTGSGGRQHLNRVIHVLLQAVYHHRQRRRDLHLRLGGLRQRVGVLPRDLVILQVAVQAGVRRRVPGHLQRRRRERGATDVLRRAARHCEYVGNALRNRFLDSAVRAEDCAEIAHARDNLGRLTRCPRTRSIETLRDKSRAKLFGTDNGQCRSRYRQSKRSNGDLMLFFFLD